MDKYILEKIYNAYCNGIKSDQELEELTSGLQMKLLKTLDEEETILFGKYKDAKTEELENLSYESFKQGVRASIMLIVEAFN